MIPAISHNHRHAYFKAALVWFAAIVCSTSPCGGVNYEPSAIVPPRPVREFRGVWIATVANIDWPSKRGLSTAMQKQELIAILDAAARLQLNAVILQVRPACDAFYASSIEPWSEYLTGTMGRAPAPFYDPLAFAVDQAHQRGLELHAWFNPYRALHFSSKSSIAPNHVSKTHPQLVKRYGKYLWLDPGEREVQDYSLRVVLDVVRRYDIDGVQFDDYFYPDPAEGNGTDFPDAASWARYGSSRQTSCADWRRENVNTFVRRVYQSIKAVKPWVKFGISPPGIWRPGFPPQIKGKDTYSQLYADSREWLANGWLDYFAPQLYWPIESREQSFPALLNWWEQQNLKGRGLWPGLAVYKAGEWEPEEIPNQIRLLRRQSGVTGCAFFSASSLLRDQALVEKLKQAIGTAPALVPASPWLGTSRPAKPTLFTSSLAPGSLRLWIAEPAQETSSRWWLLQTCWNGSWTTEVLPASTRIRVFGSFQPAVIAVTRIDRFGNASEAAVLERKASTPVAPQNRPSQSTVPPKKKSTVKRLGSPHESDWKK